MGDSKVRGVSSLSHYKRQFLASFVASIGSFGLGTVFGWSAPALPSLTAGQELGILNHAESSWIASLAIFGALISGPVSGLLINRIGRKILMLFMALPFILGWCLISDANNLGMIYAGRFLTGFAGGSYTVTIPIYVSEIAHESVRGTLGSLMVLSIVSGILFTFVFGTIASWSGLSLICLTVPILFLVLMMWMPESPRYLLAKGMLSEAEKSIEWLQGSSDQKQIDREVIKIKSTLGHATNATTKPVKTPYIKQLLLSMSLFVFQQFGGINGVTMYTVEIFESAGSPFAPNTASIIIGIVQVLFVLLSLLIVDKVGRKSLLVVSDLIMALSMLALGSFYYFKEQNGGEIEGPLSLVPLVSLVTFVIAYSVGAGPLPWLLSSELIPASAIDFGSSIVSFCYWVLAFISAKSFENHFYHYWIYSLICFGGVLFTFFLIPETMGKTQMEIQRHFGSTLEERDSFMGKDEEKNILNVNHSSPCDSMVDFDNNVKSEKV